MLGQQLEVDLSSQFTFGCRLWGFLWICGVRLSKGLKVWRLGESAALQGSAALTHSPHTHKQLLTTEHSLSFHMNLSAALNPTTNSTLSEPAKEPTQRTVCSKHLGKRL